MISSSSSNNKEVDLQSAQLSTQPKEFEINTNQEDEEFVSYRRFDLVKLTTINSAIQFIFAIQVCEIFFTRN
jgi:hypothetical protein